MSGEASEMAAEAARFAAKLKRQTGIDTELMDERLTSWQAEQMASELSSAKRRKQGPLDDVAAAILLREYLERHNAKAGATTEKR